LSVVSVWNNRKTTAFSLFAFSSRKRLFRDSHGTFLMPIRIVHTADNHIGIPYRQFQEDIRRRLVSERFEALARLVRAANDREADFFVVAGDLFDSTRVKVADIDRTVELLKEFSGEAVLIVPGNHDFVSGPESDLWKRFQRGCESVNNIEVLTEPVVREFEVNGMPIQFSPVPAHRRPVAIRPSAGSAVSSARPRQCELASPMAMLTGLVWTTQTSTSAWTGKLSKLPG
jgi:hypothetical protein